MKSALLDEQPAPHIELKGISQRFGDNQVLRDVNLRVRRGDVAVLVGGSGAGKTTLVRILIGLLRPTSGSVWIAGEELTRMDRDQLRAARSKFGMVFQYSALLDSLTVFDNVALPLREHTRLARSEIAARVTELLESLSLVGVEQRLPAELSGGMRKRVALARALIRRPQIVIYDEPTSGLDPLTARRVDELILETRDRYNVTSVVISHDMAQAAAIASQLLFLEQGKIVASGTPRELVAQEGSLAARFFQASGVAL